MAAFDRILSGIPEMDKAFDNIRIGDNVVWRVSSLDEFKLFMDPYIEQAMGISKGQIVAFGDDYVDVEMLAQCGVGVAMGNAVDGVRQYADIVIGDNDSDAIADYIENSDAAFWRRCWLTA